MIQRLSPRGRGNQETTSGSPPLQLYHGAQRWQGPPKIRRLRTAEHGPGIYLTTSWSRARRYARGSGTVQLFTLATPLRWLHEAPHMPIGDVVSWVWGLPRLRRRQVILDNLFVVPGTGKILAQSVVNAFVAAGQATSAHGPELALFLVSRGIDAALIRLDDEDWVVLFNPRKVLTVSRVPPTPEVFDLPRVSP